MTTATYAVDRNAIAAMTVTEICDAQLAISRAIDGRTYAEKNTPEGLRFNADQSAIYRAMTTELRNRGLLNY